MFGHLQFEKALLAPISPVIKKFLFVLTTHAKSESSIYPHQTGLSKYILFPILLVIVHSDFHPPCIYVSGFMTLAVTID